MDSKYYFSSLEIKQYQQKEIIYEKLYLLIFLNIVKNYFMLKKTLFYFLKLVKLLFYAIHQQSQENFPLQEKRCKGHVL